MLGGLRRASLDLLFGIRERTGISVAKQMDCALALYRSEFDWDSREFLQKLKDYAAQGRGAPPSSRGRG